jgi:phospholipase C
VSHSLALLLQEPAKYQQNLRRWLATIIALFVILHGAAASAETARPIDQIKHVIVIYLENWSFDGLFGRFPGANGHANAGASVQQVKKDGTPYETLPQPLFQGKPDMRIPSGLPVAPYDLAPYVPPGELTDNLVHLFYQEQYQINGGRMDRFVAWNDSGGDHGGLAMGYYDATSMPLGRLARAYTLCDNFFHSAFGGSWFNHMWLISARTPLWREAPQSMRAQLDKDGVLIPGTRQDAEVTPEGFVVNTVFAATGPSPKNVPKANLLPLQTAPTIGDRLSERGVSWAWYSGGWNETLAGRPPKLFQYHHQPFAYFARYAKGTPGRKRHLKDESEFFRALTAGTLPAVSFVKPLGDFNEHPGYATLAAGQEHLARLVHAVQRSRYWPEALIIITFDEHGGRWDHVAPPVIDRWGPGSRVPTVIVSPFAKKSYVDSTQYETVSILKFIATRWRLKPLTERDANANDLTNALEF